jgi:hypothetical protein
MCAYAACIQSVRTAIVNVKVLVDTRLQDHSVTVVSSRASLKPDLVWDTGTNSGAEEGFRPPNMR